MASDNLDRPFNLRVNGKQMDDFVANAEKINRKPTDLIRELMTAFNESRLQITQPENGIYNVRK